MTGRKLFYLLIVLSFPASFICFYGTNLILSDVANMFYMTLTRDVISSLPIFLLGVEFVMASINIVHYGLHPNAGRRLVRLNAIATAAVSAAGAVCAVLSGAWIYGSFTAPYPFPGATLLTLAVHVVLIVLALLTARGHRDAEPTSAGFFLRLARAGQWLFMAIFIYYAFDRFGAVLWMPVYVQFSTLYKTIFFYLSLLLPVCLLLHHCRYRLRLYRNWKLAGTLYPLLYLAADLCLCAAVVTGGINDTQFVAAISPALGIERLLSKPIITIIHFCLMTLPILASFFVALTQNILKRRKDARAARAQ